MHERYGLVTARVIRSGLLACMAFRVWWPMPCVSDRRWTGNLGAVETSVSGRASWPQQSAQFLGRRQCFEDTIAHPRRGRLDGVSREMRVVAGSLNLGMRKELPNHREAFVTSHGSQGKDAA